MARGGPARVVLALRPARGGDLGVEHCGHHRHASGHAHRQQRFPGHLGDTRQGEADLIGQIQQFFEFG